MKNIEKRGDINRPLNSDEALLSDNVRVDGGTNFNFSFY